MNNLAAFKAGVWSKSLITNLDKINVMLALVNRNWEGDLKKGGDTVHVRTLGNVQMRQYTKGTAITYEDLTPATEPMTVSDSSYFAFQVEDIDAAQNDLDALSGYTMRAAVSMNDAVEKKCLSNYAQAHTSNRITGAASAAIVLTADNVYSHFVKARTALSKNSVPMTGRWAVIDPDTTGLLLESPKFVNATIIGNQAAAEGRVNGDSAALARPGFVGRIAGFDVYESNNAPVVGSDVFLQFGDGNAIAYAAVIAEIESLRLQSQFGNAVRGLLLHDSKVFAEASKRLGYIKRAN